MPSLELRGISSGYELHVHGLSLWADITGDKIHAKCAIKRRLKIEQTTIEGPSKHGQHYLQRQVRKTEFDL